MPDVIALIAALGGGALVGSALTWAALKYRELLRRVKALEAKDQAQTCSKHDLRYLANQKVGEAFLFEFVQLEDEIEIARQKLQHFIKHAQYVATGGDPDTRPDKWGGNQ